MTSTILPSSRPRPPHGETRGRDTTSLLRDRFTAETGTVHLTGIQALVRMIRDRAIADRLRGLATSSYISGYEGSPLGGFDLELAKRLELMQEFDVIHQPAVNEELGATAASGAQLNDTLGTRRPGVDGVVSYWYGKAPGLDRAADAFRHANLIGTASTSGAVAIVGDDPTAKSSSVASNSSRILADLGMPTLVPADSADILTLGQHAAWLSRECGLWTALRVNTTVADGSSTVTLGGAHPAPEPPSQGHVPHARLLGQNVLDLEESKTGSRLRRALMYSRKHNLNRLVHASPEDKVGVIAAGSSSLEVEEALRSLGSPARVRVARMGMTWPLDASEMEKFATGLNHILVVEDLGNHLFETLRTTLYGSRTTPVLSHAHDAIRGIANMLRTEGIDFDEPARTSVRRTLPLNVAKRVPHYCSGCPHNSSTRVAPGTLVGAGIGCHSMVLMQDEERVGNIHGFSQMGGEGCQWMGISPFVEERHLVQNLGDGTLLHSGSLAIRQLVAAKVNITVKILHNGTVAMTGGQDPVGQRSLPGMVELVHAEDVAKIVVTTDDVKRTRRGLPRSVEVRPREDLAAVQEELAAMPGVTVLIHDQHCAAEKRRARSRGTVAPAMTKVVINERICEGCGDCGDVSGCLSVRPVETEFGRKTRIDQTTCNADYTCLQGDCPAFTTVTVTEGPRSSTVPEIEPLDSTALPSPTLPRLSDRSWNVRVTGVGGTGILTLAAVIATAAQMEGFHVRGSDMTGLAQKGGSVVSDIRLSSHAVDEPGVVPADGADLMLGVDGLTTAEPGNLGVINPRRTTAVLSSTNTPTVSMVTDVRAEHSDGVALAAALGRNAHRMISMDAAEVSRLLFGATTFQTMIMLGVAQQSGALPVNPDAVEAAISANGRSVEANLQAFRRGRQWVADPKAITELLQLGLSGQADYSGDSNGKDGCHLAQSAGVPAPSTSEPTPTARMRTRAALRSADLTEELCDIIARRVDELEAWGSEADATRFLLDLKTVAYEERRVSPASTDLLREVAFGLHKLTAYKDEYEVARLALDPEFRTSIDREFGADADVKIQLHPPMLRALGVKRKIGFGRSSLPVLKVLSQLKPLRDTPFDVFGHGEVRRMEKELAATYREAMLTLARRLRDERDLTELIELAQGADRVRGYESLKLTSGREFLEELRSKMQEG